jgi:hypothetical protein
MSTEDHRKRRAREQRISSETTNTGDEEIRKQTQEIRRSRDRKATQELKRSRDRNKYLLIS